MERRSFLVGTGAATLGFGLAPAAFSQERPEKTRIALGVGGQPLLYYLPLTIAEQKGYFKEEGLDVEINDFGGGARALQALVGGSVDVVTGAYEHTIRMQAKGQDVRALVELGRFPGIAVGVRKELAAKVGSPADFKGLKVGVTAPGSSTYLLCVYAMVKAGLKASDVGFIGIGGGAGSVAAFENGLIDVISHTDPVISKLQFDDRIKVLVDTRTEKGTRDLFGGTNPAAVLYTKADFIERNPVSCQRLVNAFGKALRWLAQARTEEIVDAVPQAYLLNDRTLYAEALKNFREGFSKTGIVSPDGMQSVYGMLKLLDPELSGASVDLTTTFVDIFAKRAALAP